ncbi:MAG: MvaI/BcnI restriction endonuclease family protein [Treponema sp.]|jgi:hypothetical protein|nr:MvaI/BcnI restriction endonuclease family protein [Treponema sp.]
MNFNNFENIGQFLLTLGVTRAFFKPLSENDNSKNQIYLGGSFSVLQEIPFGEIREFPEGRNPNYKANINFWWINNTGQISKAPKTQLILYTRYPEVRFSGFLSNCPTAPNEYMRAPGLEERQKNNEKDGRVLIFGVCPDNRIYGYLATKNSSLANSILHKLFNEECKKTIQDFPLQGISETGNSDLVRKLREIVNAGWHESIRLDANGSVKSYQAGNGGGYTLEALFGIVPNGIAEPDYKGWELKSFSGARITLMTREPDKGFYHEKGAKEFTLKYGHDADGVKKYFTGTHKANILNTISKMTLIIKDFDWKAWSIPRSLLRKIYNP